MTLRAEDLLAGHEPDIAALAQRLRRIVSTTVPEAEERVYPTWHGLGYRHPEAGYFCGIFPREDVVNLAFEYGVLMEDPDGLLSAGRTGMKKVRHVEVRRPGDVREAGIRALLHQAVALRSGPVVRRKRTR
jgi:hypothetical protein